MTRSCKSSQIAVTLVGVVLIAVGSYLCVYFRDIFTSLRAKKMALSPTSATFPSWRASPLPLTLDIYLFNWTNPGDFYVGSAVKPHFHELGPYKFRENKTKVDYVWHPHNGSVTYRKKSLFHFDAAASNGRLDDLITSVNTVAHGMALHFQDAGLLKKFGMDTVIVAHGGSPSITKTADEWLFTGYADGLLTLGRFFSSDDVPYDRVGWFYARNGSSSFEGVWNIHTGQKDFSKMGQVHTWNGKQQTGAFAGACGNVSGAAGEFFPSGLTENDTVSIFMANMCRAIPLDFEEPIDVHGVTAYKYAAGARAVDNGTTYPETKCYCVNGKCEPAGVINIAPCKYNSPMYMSYPHFYKADPSYLAAIDGLTPNKSKHEFFMALEPDSGLPMKVGGGFQANYLMEPVSGFKAFQNIPRTFLPLMWCEQKVLVTEAIASRLSMIPRVLLIGRLVAVALILFGIICAFWHPLVYANDILLDRRAKSSLKAAQSSVARNRKADITSKSETSSPAAQNLLPNP